MPLFRGVLTTLVLLLPAATWSQPLSFSRADYRASAAPRAIVAADFNRDGAIDLAMVNTGRDSLNILINATARGQGFVQTHDIVLGGGPFDLAAADLNNDSVVDLVAANADLNTIDIILGTTAGGFETPIHIPASGNPRGVALADLDGDGRQDIVYTQFYLNSVQVLHGDGAGNFVARIPALATGARPQGVSIGRYMGCCRPAIAVANTGSSRLSVFRQGDEDTFSRVDVAGESPMNVLTSGDFNRDGHVDLAAASSATSKLSLYGNTGTGLGFSGTFAVGASPRGVEAADLNKDGRLDLVTANRAANGVSVLIARADASGWFNPPFTVAAANGARDVALADFNFDGQIDIATANEFSNSATVLTNSSRPPAGVFWELRAFPAALVEFGAFVAVADFNSNGVLDVLRSGEVLLDGSTAVALSRGVTRPIAQSHGATGDFDGDGRADVVVTANHQQDPQFYVADLYRGNGAGAFEYAGSFGSFNWISELKAADVDNNGRPDLVVADVTMPGARVHVLLATGTGFAARPPLDVAAGIAGLDLADVNGDGKLDIVAGHNYEGPGVEIFLGDGAGGFSANQFLSADRRVDVSAVDVNHDGHVDIVSSGHDGVAVWLGSPTGIFAVSQTYGRIGLNMAVADFTADGHVDVLSDGELLRGRGDGTFAEPEPVNIDFWDAQPVDYDRDGRMDLVLITEWYTMVLYSRASRGENFAPVVDAGPDWSYRYEVQFEDHECGGEGKYYDPNLDPLTAEWLDERGRIVANGESLCQPFVAGGTHTFRLVVRDPYGGESSDTKTVTVTPLKESVVHVGYSSTEGGWRQVDDSTAAEEFRMWHPDAGAPKVTPALAAPAHYFTAYLLADPTQTYKIWVRLKAQNNSWANDSIFVQFGEGAVVANGQTRYRAGTTDAIDINLERCSGCGVSGWGWRDERWGSTLNAVPILLRFPKGGGQRIVVQTREDGVSVDQIVFSAEQYLSSPPGPAKNDSTILPPTWW